MAINFVIGPPCAGKSHFIKNVFKDAVVVDLWEFQKDIPVFTRENLAESYTNTLNALTEAIEDNPDSEIVLEHTLLKAIRRQPYIEAVRELTDEPINCFVLRPYKDIYKKLCKMRKTLYDPIGIDMLENPTAKEGFENIYFINPKP